MTFANGSYRKHVTNCHHYKRVKYYTITVLLSHQMSMYQALKTNYFPSKLCISEYFLVLPLDIKVVYRRISLKISRGIEGIEIQF